MRISVSSIRRCARLLGLVLLIAAASGCAKPTVAERMKQHRSKVAAAQRYIRGLERYEDAVLDRYLAGVMERLADASGVEPIPVSVLDASHANAYVSERDGVRVTRGMLALLSDEAELAVILGHEIAHLSQPDRITGWRSLLENGADAEELPTRLANVLQQREISADQMAMQMAARAGYDTGAAYRVIGKLSALEQGRAEDVYIRSHPLGKDRIAALSPPRDGETAGGRFRKAVDGIPFGGFAQNYFRSEGRVHAPFLKLSFPMPKGMEITDQDESLITFKNTRADMTFYLTRLGGEDKDSELSLRRAVYEVLDRRIGLGALRDVRRSRGFRNASTITATSMIDNSEPSFTVRFVMIAHEGDWLSGVLFHPARRKAEGAALIDEFVAGLKEEPSTDPWRLRYVAFGPAQSLQNLARDWGAGDDGMRIFRAVNDLKPSEAPRAGRPIKTVSKR